MPIESVLGYLIPVGVLVLGLAVLLFSAERLVAASEDIGVAMGVPPFVMGITVLAVGTSLPELVTGLFALDEGSGEIVVGTALGSNIANILLILGFASLYAKEIRINWDLLHGDLPMLFGSLLLIGFFIYPVSAADMELFRSAGENGPSNEKALISVTEGIVLLSSYGLYLYYYTRQHRFSGNATQTETERGRISLKSALWVLVGLIGVPIGANYTVDAAIELAEKLLVGKEVVAASMISIGTSLPELVVSYSAVKRKNYEMALGNVTGSNIFNTFIVVGLPAILAPYMGTGKLLSVGDDSILFLQMPFYIAAVVVFLVVVLDKKLTRTEGMIFLVAYAVFIAKLYSFI